MKVLIALLLILISGLEAHASSVVLRDLQPKDDEYLKKALPTLFVDNPDQAILDEAIRALMSHGNYENVFVERRGDGSYEIIGKPIRLIDMIEFHGTHYVSESELRELLDFKVGDRFDRKRAVAAAEKMKNFYGENGFFDAIIELSFQKTENKNIKLVFEIQEKQPCVIRGLTFTTVNRDLKVKLESHFAHLKRRYLTTDRARHLMTDLTDYLNSERYLAAEVLGPDAEYNADKTEAFLKFEIREPWRYEFYFSGNLFFSYTDIMHALDFANKERKNVDPASEGAERLRRAYLEKGFPNVQIETKVSNPPNTYLKRVTYILNEGPRVHIKAIEVQGRISRTSSYYQDFIYKNSSTLVERGYYNRQDLENGFKNLVTDLRNQGFLHARILSSRVEFNDKRTEATIFLLLEEGPQTEIRALEFEGNHFFSNFELAEVSGLETNAPLHLNTFEQSLVRLKDFYHNQGFLEMKLLNENQDLIKYNDKGTQARVLFQIYEGPRIHIKNVLVEGNSLTKSYVILREADFHVGDVLTPSSIDDASARLNKMGLFSRADIHTSDENTNVTERSVVITVTERDPGLFTFGAGLTNERRLTVRGFGGASYSNLGGTARGISLRGELKQNVAQINYPEHEISAGYLEPFLLNSRTRGRVNLTRSEHVFDYDPGNTATKLTTSHKIDLLAERDLTRHTRLTYKVWGLESNKEWERHGRCFIDPNHPNDPFTFDPNKMCPPNLQQIGTTGPTFDIDYRDSPFLPTRGSRTLFVTTYADPAIGSSRGIRFIKTEGNFTHYTRLGSPSLVWANSLRGGYVSNLSRDAGSGVPTNYAFLLGGLYTVRGFDLSSNEERIPRQHTGGIPGIEVNSGNQKLIPLDSHFYLVKTELRFPISGEHGGVLFYDGGAVEVTGFHFGRPYRDSVGVGYRYNTPVGPLALDLAFKILPEPGEDKFRFHLSIGTF